MNAKYKQKKRHYRNSGLVILADLKVSAAPAHLPGKGCPTPNPSLSMDPRVLAMPGAPQ